MKRWMVSVAAGVVAFPLAVSAQDGSSMSFFITSVGSGNGADLGGLDGADAHCQSLASAAGAGDLTWRAYLSAAAAGDAPAVNARDRIGTGPWHNAKGEEIAADLDQLHSDAANITKETGLTENGDPVNGRGDSPNQHDILTGSTSDGMLAGDAETATCGNWTSSSAGNAVVGHHDRMGLRDDAPSKSWNSSHQTRSCSQEDLIRTGGNGYFYCFAEQ